ncbi:cytochrome P450 [Streptomyces sp. NPDC101062]|uniref:cytochrome P450 n=1 Tax=unclassified Streptomyces TaxID=2593676 RepID=UPI002E764250|nr:cytochrome P450 [Streptomyces sp. JV176]MEE1801179.1 cytochrome P450 [Streptomyces sp. JV176]
MSPQQQQQSTQRPEPLSYPFWNLGGLDPHPGYQRLWDQPLARVRLAYGEDSWLATRHEDVRAVLSDPRFSIGEAVHRDHPRIERMPRISGGLLTSADQDHSRMRSLLSKEFTARRIERLRDRIRRTADGLLDRMEEIGPPADMIEDYAFPLPMTIICELVGIPYADHVHVRHWADVVCSGSTPPETILEEAGIFNAHMSRWVEAHRQEPADDLLTILVRGHDEEGIITEGELIDILGELLIGGFVTTTNQIGNFFSLMLLHQESGDDMMARLRADLGLVPKAVEELLRFVPLLNGVVLPRYAMEDIELGGVLIRAGEPVIVSPTAANRDPEVFPEPDEVDLDRPGNPHVSFGHGAHYCLGAHLARLELQVTLEQVVTRWPELRLAVGVDELRWRSKEFFSGLYELPIAW